MSIRVIRAIMSAVAIMPMGECPFVTGSFRGKRKKPVVDDEEGEDEDSAAPLPVDDQRSGEITPVFEVQRRDVVSYVVSGGSNLLKQPRVGDSPEL